MRAGFGTNNVQNLMEQSKFKDLLPSNGEGKWVITSAVNEHNHELDLENAHFFWSFRKISTLVMSQIQGLDAPGVQPSKIFSILGKQVGGIRNTQCKKRIVAILLVATVENYYLQVMLVFFRTILFVIS